MKTSQPTRCATAWGPPSLRKMHRLKGSTTSLQDLLETQGRRKEAKSGEAKCARRKSN